MITKEMVHTGYKNGIIKIIDSPKNNGCVCSIGEDGNNGTITNWFYFGGLTAEKMNAEEYVKNVPESEIINEIFDTLDEMYIDASFQDEYLFYETILDNIAEKKINLNDTKKAIKKFVMI